MTDKAAGIIARARFEHQLIRSGCADITGMWDKLPEKGMKIPMIEEMEAAIEALSSAGLVIKPKEPTEETVNLIIQAMRFDGDWRATAKRVYAAMLSEGEGG